MQRVILTLPRVRDMELTASKAASVLGEHIGMGQDKIDEVRMAVVEACINSFEHSGTREVRIHLVVVGEDEDPQGMRITIEDGGVGFSLDKLQNKLREPHSMQKRGHGLRIIQGLMDTVDIQSDSHGTRVVMTKMC
jgi:anti-sigma regulatory factor (Ser/Thr protein kinase)